MLDLEHIQVCSSASTLCLPRKRLVQGSAEALEGDIPVATYRAQWDAAHFFPFFFHVVGVFFFLEFLHLQPVGKGK